MKVKNDGVIKKYLAWSFMKNQRGFTLFELLIAMLLLAMVSVMIYSVLNVGIKFSAKGESKILAMEHKYGFLNLFQSQVSSAVYDPRQRKILMSVNDDVFRIVTRNPYIYEEAGEVLAIYRYDTSERAIYYTEKRDYYNLDYNDEYVPDFADMTLLDGDEESFGIKYDKVTGPEVTLLYRGEEYSMVPKCTDDEDLAKLQTQN